MRRKNPSTTQFSYHNLENFVWGEVVCVDDQVGVEPGMSQAVELFLEFFFGPIEIFALQSDRVGDDEKNQEIRVGCLLPHFGCERVFLGYMPGLEPMF